MSAWGSAQESDYPQDNQALKARLNPAWLLNPRHIARRNQRRACEATRGIPPERCECDGVFLLRINVFRSGLELTRAHRKHTLYPRCQKKLR